jgi:hypothetical protein
MDNGVPVTVMSFNPIGVDNQLQMEITKLMDTIVKERGDMTLAEMGYLHMSSVAFTGDHVEAKVFFAPELAMDNEHSVNGSMKAIPNEALNVFQNYLFVGDVADNVSFGTITCPKYRIEEDALGIPAVTIKEGKGFKEDTEVVVLNCNLDLMLAAILDIDLFDKYFSVSYQTLGKNGEASKKNKKDEEENPAPGIMISMGANQEFPVMIMVKYSHNGGGMYRPENAIPYLLAKLQASKETKSVKKELAQQVSDSAERMVKKDTEKLTAWKKFR